MLPIFFMLSKMFFRFIFEVLAVPPIALIFHTYQLVRIGGVDNILKRSYIFLVCIPMDIGGLADESYVLNYLTLSLDTY